MKKLVAVGSVALGLIVALTTIAVASMALASPASSREPLGALARPQVSADRLPATVDTPIVEQSARRVHGASEVYAGGVYLGTDENGRTCVLARTRSDDVTGCGIVDESQKHLGVLSRHADGSFDITGTAGDGVVTVVAEPSGQAAKVENNSFVLEGLPGTDNALVFRDATGVERDREMLEVAAPPAPPPLGG